MATELSVGEEEGKVTGGNQVLIVEDDLREMGKKAAWSVSSCKPRNGVCPLRWEPRDLLAVINYKISVTEFLCLWDPDYIFFCFVSDQTVHNLIWLIFNFRRKLSFKYVICRFLFLFLFFYNPFLNLKFFLFSSFVCVCGSIAINGVVCLWS